jgi:hypothetical protein
MFNKLNNFTLNKSLKKSEKETASLKKNGQK